jgi:ABC-type transport system substrate-binding protein
VRGTRERDHGAVHLGIDGRGNQAVERERLEHLGAQHSVLSPVSPAAVAEHGVDFGFNPVGTGPFMFKEWKQQISMTFVRNPDYNWPLGVYQHEGPAYLDEIVIKFIPEASTISAP